MMTIISDFKVTQVKEKHKKMQSDVKDYVLGLVDARKKMNEEDLDEVTHDNLMEEKAQIIETVDEKINEIEKQETN